LLIPSLCLLRDENGGELERAKWMVVQEYLLSLELGDDGRKLLTTNLDQRGARHMGIDRDRDRDILSE
jgi:hypothetical protein